jgi:thiamine pyrophosphokinase
VFLNGDYDEGHPFYGQLARSADVILAADGGAEHVASLGLVPHIVVGDFDSLARGRVDELARAGAEIIRHPVRKDETDAELAVDEAVKRGAREVVLTGALGGGIDHALGSLAVLRKLAARGARARIAEPRLTACVALAAHTVVVANARGARFSCVPLTARAVLTLSGFDYELDHEALRADACRGLGNTVVRARARAAVHRGAAALLLDAGPPAALLISESTTRVDARGAARRPSRR